MNPFNRSIRYLNPFNRNRDTTFIYSALADNDAEQALDDLVKTKGFFILPSELFENVLNALPLMKT